jgi:hypothetical protein
MMRAELSTAETEVVLVPMLTQEDAGRDSSPVRMGADAIGWIGTGSVGLPTNAQRRAEYLILDDKAWHVEKYAVAYPREQARAHTREVLSAVCAKEVAERIARWL